MADRSDPGKGDPQADAAGLADVRDVATRAGLVINDEDAKRLVAASRRVRAMAAEVRRLSSPDVEPSGPAVTPWRARGR